MSQAKPVMNTATCGCILGHLLQIQPCSRRHSSRNEGCLKVKTEKRTGINFGIHTLIWGAERDKNVSGKFW